MRNKAVVCLSFAVACIVSWQLTSVVRGFVEPTPRTKTVAAAESPGALRVVDKEGTPKGLCPLEHTDVKIEATGLLSRVTVEQKFSNTFEEAIEAVYTFPLPHHAAVDRMTMKIGERTIEGKIFPRDRARALYDEARNAGRTASLLDQQRPNVFTQSVANIPPGERVDVRISYVAPLDYEDGAYKLVFPMVVGPRYNPESVVDAGRISPPVAAPETRAGHDVSIEVAIDAGVPILDLRSTLHEIDLQRTSDRTALVTLADHATIPNKDFVLTYEVAGAEIEDAFFTHRTGSDGFFALVLQPPARPAVEQIAARELVFVLDTSGSMSGFPIEKAKETMDLAFDALRQNDTFNLITFAGDTRILFPEPVPATSANLARARSFLASSSGGGGTEMMKAIRAALAPSRRGDAVRVVCFMTDGYIGNDMEIVAEVQKHPAARVFSFGIGNSVNRYLLDRMADVGRGEVEYVALSDDGSAAARRFAERVNAPVLTDVTIDWGGLDVRDVYPERIPDVFGAKPIVVCGRYGSAGDGTVTVRGRSGGRDAVRELAVRLPATAPGADVVAKLWARERVEGLMNRDLMGIQRGAPDASIKEEITKIGIEFGLMTQFTSFLAVEERIVTEGGAPRRVEVPVEMPDGVEHEAVFGDAAGFVGGRAMQKSATAAPPAPYMARRDRPEVVPSRPVPPAPPVAEPKGRGQRVATKLLLENAIEQPKAVLSATARAHGIASGPVEVEIAVDKKGLVVSARAISGHPLLRDAAVRAARRWKFRPSIVPASAERVVGVIPIQVEP